MKIPASLRWKALETLGSGGQATVIKVEDKTGEHSGHFALKGLAKGKPIKAYERFAREVEAIRRLDHPSIIRIVDHSVQADEFHYYVMEYFDGARPLKKVLGKPDSPFAGNALRSLRVFRDIVSAIAAWSKVGVVHRDLSPGNILILPDNSIKVIDFGICQIEDHGTITLADEGVGTANYMAPECEAGVSGNATELADLYSAGKILWSCVTNLLAFARESPAFTSKTMSSIFPDSPEIWHLHHLFAVTVRQSIADRASSDGVLSTVERVRYLISAGFPPLEVIATVCPICGIGRLGPGEQLHSVFGNPNPPGIGSYQCPECGTCFAINHRVLQGNLERRKTLL